MGAASNPKVDEAVDAYRLALSNDPENVPEQQAFAHQHGIQPSTFSRRLNGVQKPRTSSHTKLQALTPTEEAELVSLIRHFTLLGHPLPYTMIREVAKELRQKRLCDGGTAERDIEPLGRNWAQKLRGRHPTLIRVWTKRTEKARKRAALPEKLKTWFSELDRVRRLGKHLPANIWNMDETGYAVGAVGSEQCMIALDYSERRAVDEARKVGGAGKQGQEWVTTIDCISAGGEEVPTLIILPGNVEYDPRNRPNDLRAAGWALESTPSGWTNHAIGLKWLTLRFLPYTQPADPNERRLLIVDGHSSHVRADFIAECMKYNVDLMILPAHSSHKTQPLDVGVFHAIKKRLAYVTAHHWRYSTRQRIPRHLWMDMLLHARAAGMTPSHIATGFRKTGIEPYDPNIVSLGQLPLPSPSQTPSTPLQAAASLADSILDDLDGNIDDKTKQKIRDLAATAEALKARNIIVEGELERYQKVNETPPRAGVTVAHIGTHLFTQRRVLGEIRGREEVTNARKARKTARDEATARQRLLAGSPTPQLPSHTHPSTIRSV